MAQLRLERDEPAPGVPAVPGLAGGRWITPAAERWELVYNPATGEVIARVPFATGADVAAAVEAAAAAYPAWRRVPPVERARLMFRYRDLLERHFEELALSITREHGKTLAEARAEVRRGIEVVEFAAGAPTLMLGEMAEDVARGIDSELVRVPLGVVAGICPFNFPAMIPLWMFPIAVACGNTFVLKPSERTPLTAVRLAELFLEAGAPEGVLNLVHGGREVANALVAHPGVKAVSFVGSQPAAQNVYAEAARHGKRVQALGGAKNHLIVMPDADLEATVGAVVSSAFGSAGQRCLAGSVVVAVGEVGDPLVAALAEAAGKLVVGEGTDPQVDMGPVIRAEARDRIAGYIERGARSGAALVLDGRKHPHLRGPEGGFWMGPTLFDHVQPGHELACDEIFGPVLSVVRVPDLDTAIAVANRSRYGNAASIFTRSGAAARAFRYGIEAGMLGINVGVAAPMAWFPFSGWKASFYGDLHATGKDGVRFYTEVKMVTSRW
ncbi:CoA-acylating methylmalonate-semialdehyde dehydrogenase [Thermaerobacter subterraneus]|uniref:methylmalonate-semialdehyde dehydrogenase (CoA acylating) n=1 Tax=Thermaerobacter subterraneus DSM 13965 TaxID=867903 RepID=K6P2L7_9FIRM|nr:CoA-acylating methylmalonate-semialdehyde dehydrogenase [Thermaerobacter subterraneus]EKP95315.1 methylmalonic acid semialdehyde dehydrogenase [Thermaerobacter subterraneus DSM 13965]